MIWTRFRPSKQAVFVILMLASALAVLAPPRWTDGLKHVTQLLVFAQDPVSRATRRAVAAAGVDNGSTDEAALSRSLRNTVASQHGEIQHLHAEIRRLSALRNNIDYPLPLLRARVVAHDAVAYRDIVLTNRGRSRDVRRDDWVVSGFFVDRGTVHEVAVDQSVLAGESLVGRVAIASPFVSRVRLLTDVDSKLLEVRIGRFVPGPSGGKGRFLAVDYVCNIAGRGGGEMVVSDVPQDYLQIDDDGNVKDGSPRIRIGDLVMTAAGLAGMPVSMAVGCVSRFESDPEERLVYDLIVEPLVPRDRIDYVYIIPLVPTGRVAGLDP